MKLGNFLTGLLALVIDQPSKRDGLNAPATIADILDGVHPDGQCTTIKESWNNGWVDDFDSNFNELYEDPPGLEDCEPLEGLLNEVAKARESIMSVKQEIRASRSKAERALGPLWKESNTREWCLSIDKAYDSIAVDYSHLDINGSMAIQELARRLLRAIRLDFSHSTKTVMLHSDPIRPVPEELYFISGIFGKLAERDLDFKKCRDNLTPKLI